MKTLLVTVCCSLLFIVATLSWGQVIFPTPTPVITPTPTPSVTPMKGTTPVGTATPYQHTTASPSPPVSSPTPTPIPSPYAVPTPPSTNPQAGTNLEWREFPPNSGGPKYVFVLLIHEGGFWEGGWSQGNMLDAARDLAAAGFFAVVVDYTLAPGNLIDGQPPHSGNPASGRPPWQTDDIKALVNAARNDPRCNGTVAILGGSSGGSHAVFVVLDTTDTGTDWPFWKYDKRPQFVASLSGGYDLSDRDGDTTSYPNFIRDVENYTNSTTPSVQWGDSAIANWPTATDGYVPMYFINSDADSGMPTHQMWDMFNAFYQNGYPTNMYRMWTIPGSSAHGFAFWNDPIQDINPNTDTWHVKDRVVGYFEYFLLQGNTHF